MKKLLFWGPVLTASGYGEHARQLLKTVAGSGFYDVAVKSVRWGSTPLIDEMEDVFVSDIKALEKKHFEGAQYDVSIQVTIPNEFQKLAKFNIGVTAGIETDRASPKWIEKINETVDLVIVPSKHSAETLANIRYRSHDGSELFLKKPVVVAPEGFDSSFFNTERNGEVDERYDFDTEFNFVSVGLGLDKPFGEDRKNIGGLIKGFCEAFKGDRRVGLVLKAGLVNNSLIDFEAVRARVKQIKDSAGCGEFPKVYLVHGRMTKKELSLLYKHPKVKAYVTATHGEGFGLPIIEAAACGLPVIATDWSGHLDFLQIDGKKKFVPLKFELKDVPSSAVWEGVIERGSRWANVDETDLKTKLKKLFLSYATPSEWAQELAASLAKTHDERHISQRLMATIFSIESDSNSSHGTEEGQKKSVSMKEDMRRTYGVPDGAKTLLYTMPMSAGDVFISTAVVDSLKKKFPEHLIIFGVDEKYSDILKDNQNIFKVVKYEPWMTNVPLCETLFDEVYTPNLAIQLNTSNWVHGGKGRLLGEEIAAQCGVEFGEYWIKEEDVRGLPEKFIAFHPGSGKGQHEARNYRHWRSVVKNLQKFLPDYKIVTVGQQGDIHFEGCIDLRGMTNYNQLASVIRRASCLVGIDSVTMHMAAALDTPHVSLFGSSYATSTGPVYPTKRKSPFVLLETPNRMGCEKACYKYQCSVDKDSPCINEIDPYVVYAQVVMTTVNDESTRLHISSKWEEFCPKIAGYTHVLNAETHGYPYVESIKSMLGFCDEVVVVDGGSTDGTIEKIKAIGDDRVKLYERQWDWNEPGMDGMQKAYARAMCSVGPDDFLWQQDADEVVHEEDYEKIKKLVERFPTDVDLIHLPVVELWGAADRVRTDRHSWKWRLSRNNFMITHGINKGARVFDEKTGKLFAKKGMSDGCEFVDIMTNDFIPHKGFYNEKLELIRNKDPKSYGVAMNKIFSDLPSVYHYSWADIERKIKNFKGFWNKTWSNLYNDPESVDRFPDVQSSDDVVKKAKELSDRGGEHGYAYTFKLERSNPAVMNEWLKRIDHEISHRGVEQSS